MPTFNDSEPKGPRAKLMPEGDYILTVVGFAQKISTGQKTAGSPLYALDFNLDPEGFATDALIDAPATAWRIDIFLKACGIDIAKGTAFEFQRNIALAKNVLWINPIGLRCHAHVVVESFKTRSGADAKANKIAAYLLGKTPLARVEIEEPEETEAYPTAEDSRPF